MRVVGTELILLVIIFYTNTYKLKINLLIMYLTGGFWSDDSSEREHCYSVVPLELINEARHDVRQMILRGFELVYQALGMLGYRFRDAGHDSDHVVVSLDKPISPKHLR